MQLRTRSIARERAPPIDLRAAYLLHYYRPRLILFRRKRPRIRSSRIAHDSSIVSIHSLFSFRIARGDEKCYGEKTTRVDRIYENSSKGTENYPDEQSDGVPRHDRIRIERNTWEIPCPPAAVQSPCRSTDLSTGASFPSPPTRSPLHDQPHFSVIFSLSQHTFCHTSSSRPDQPSINR